MNTFQWVMIGLAAVLVAPVLWKQVKALIPERKPIELPPPAPQPTLSDHDHTDLVDVVECCFNCSTLSSCFFTLL